VSDSDDEDNSPSVRVMSKKLKSESKSSTKYSTFFSNISHKGVPATAKASVDNNHAKISRGGKTLWPAYTNLVYSGTGELGILVQTDEVRATIRKAIYFMEEFIIFENAFPNLAIRAAWDRKALLKAVNHLSQTKLGPDYAHYLFLKKRIKEDPDYVKDLSAVVCLNCLSVSIPTHSLKLDQRICNFRRTIKLAAAAAAHSVFQLHLKPPAPHDANTLVQDVANYICPLAAKVSDIQSTVPSSDSPRERSLTTLSPSRTRPSSKR
jgi:hypothetical protein